MKSNYFHIYIMQVTEDKSKDHQW